MTTTLFKHSVTNFYLLLFFVGLSISSVVLDIKYSNSNYIRIIINDFLITPIQYLTSTPSTFFLEFVEEKKTIEQLEQKIETLEKQNTAMKINLQRIDVLENEVSRLRSIKSQIDTNLKNIKIAQITQKDVIPNKKSVQINVGSNYKTKIIIKGRSQDNLLEVSFLPNDSEIESGDLIITSGQANRFIPSLKIGRVVEVIRSEGERFSQVIIKPLEDADKVSEVILSADER